MKHAFLCLCFLLLTACEAQTPGVSRPAGEKPLFLGTEVTDPAFSPDFRLKDAEGRTHALADWHGKVVMLFFGYASCPDICPTTLFRAAQVMKLLGDDAKRVQTLFVTLDPMRDTPDVLREYTRIFHPDFLGLYTTQEETPRLARAFRLFFRINPGETPQSYTVDHGVNTYLYDPGGKLRLLIPHESPPEALATDIRTLLR
ncbi:MAG: SCO family protein [Zoogloeaceae bacterium]|jgi:protein SCO1/2|nr:SCO family protein [Zoogloeaceae bacterium]